MAALVRKLLEIGGSIESSLQHEGAILLDLKVFSFFNWRNEIATLSPIDAVSYGALILPHASRLCGQRHVESPPHQQRLEHRR